MSYTVTSTQPNPDSRVLDQEPSYPRSIAGSYESFPAGPHKELARLAARIIKGARTPIEKALKLQNYFTSGKFAYSINVKLPGSLAGLTQFLFHTRQGYCQQFAFAMAALAREVGIPSRIAVGYTAGHSEAHGLWKVTTADAHAWPELYIGDVGWLRFEPTPGGSTGQGTATPPSYAPPRSSGPIAPPRTAGGGAGSRGSSGLPGHLLPHNIRGLSLPGGSVSRATGRTIVPQILLAVAVAAGLALITPMTASWGIRRRRLRLLGRPGRGAGPAKPRRPRPSPAA